MRSANAPTNVLPETRSPGDHCETPSPTSATTPAYSLPGTKGTGTEIW